MGGASRRSMSGWPRRPDRRRLAPAAGQPQVIDCAAPSSRTSSASAGPRERGAPPPEASANMVEDRIAKLERLSKLRERRAQRRGVRGGEGADPGRLGAQRLVVLPGIDVRGIAPATGTSTARPRGGRAASRRPCRRAGVRSSGKRLAREARADARGRRRKRTRRSARRRGPRAASPRSPPSRPAGRRASGRVPRSARSTAPSAAAIDDEQPSPNSGFSTTSTPSKSTLARTASAAPPITHRSWSKPQERAVPSTWSSSVARSVRQQLLRPAEPPGAACREHQPGDQLSAAAWPSPPAPRRRCSPCGSGRT